MFSSILFYYYTLDRKRIDRSSIAEIAERGHGAQGDDLWSRKTSLRERKGRREGGTKETGEINYVEVL